ncbi:MAG TPA: hypothetical protein DCR12_06070 [Lachnospiraceae bacterium]|nr:hypothetical protein [Lachnospiraceae bacterium]
MRNIEEDCSKMGCYKASLTVEASFIMVITMGILLSLFLIMFVVYHENVDFITDKMKDYSFNSVEAFRFTQIIQNFGR